MSDQLLALSGASAQSIVTYPDNEDVEWSGAPLHVEQLWSEADRLRDAMQAELLHQLRVKAAEKLTHESSLVAFVPQTEFQRSASNPLFSHWFMLAKSGLSPRAFGRLQAEVGKIAESSGEQLRMLGLALRLFLTFWQLVKAEAREPDLYVLPNGGLQALWSHANGSFLVMEFVGNERVYWAVNEGDNITEGQHAANSLRALAMSLKAQPNKPLKWTC